MATNQEGGEMKCARVYESFEDGKCATGVIEREEDGLLSGTSVKMYF